MNLGALLNRKRSASLKRPASMKPAASGVLKRPACYVIEDSEPEEDDLELALDRETRFFGLHLGFKRLKSFFFGKSNQPCANESNVVKHLAHPGVWQAALPTAKEFRWPSAPAWDFHGFILISYCLYIDLILYLCSTMRQWPAILLERSATIFGEEFVKRKFR